MTDHESIFQYFVGEVRGHGGDVIRSVSAFGSAVTGEFRPGKSDYNFLVVAEPVKMDLLERFAGRVKAWRKKRISVPLVITPRFIQTALDSYPLEFLSMQAGYKVLMGDDMLAGRTFRREEVRLQCEREIRSKLLIFRRAFMEARGNPRDLLEIEKQGISSLVAIFRGMLFLKRGPWTSTGTEFWDACRSSFSLPQELIPQLMDARERRKAPSRPEMREQYGRIMEGLFTLAMEVDRW